MELKLRISDPTSSKERGPMRTERSPASTRAIFSAMFWMGLLTKRSRMKETPAESRMIMKAVE